MKRILIATVSCLMILLFAGCCNRYCKRHKESCYCKRYCRSLDSERVKFDKRLRELAEEIVMSETGFYGESGTELLVSEIQTGQLEELKCASTSGPFEGMLSWSICFEPEEGDSLYSFIGFDPAVVSREAKMGLGAAHLIVEDKPDPDGLRRRRVRILTTRSIEDISYELIDGEWSVVHREKIVQDTILLKECEKDEEECEEEEEEEEEDNGDDE